jgi:hypothetical protein
LGNGGTLPRVPSLGHTILAFGFEDGRYLAFSAEATKAPDEEYGVVSGMFGAFELMDVVADERDVFGLRANVWGDDVYLYPLRLEPVERRNVFEAALAHLRERESTPAFYHSLSSNCTTNLVDLLRTGRGDVLPGWHWSYWLPASFDRLLVERGLVEGATSVEPSGGGDVGNYPLSMEIPGSLAGRRGALSVGARRIRACRYADTSFRASDRRRAKLAAPFGAATSVGWLPVCQPAGRASTDRAAISGSFAVPAPARYSRAG